MFDRLKGNLDALKLGVGDAASHKAYQSAVDAITPKIEPIFEQALQLAPGVIADDAKYRSHVIDPAWVAVAGLTSGLTSLIPHLRERFSAALVHARAELLVIDASANKVSWVDGARERLPQVLLEGFKKPL
jgi:phage-related protein